MSKAFLAAPLAALACGVLVFNATSFRIEPEGRRYWSDTAAAVKMYLDSVEPPVSEPEPAPLAKARETSQRLMTRLAKDLPKDEFWKVLPIQPFMRVRADFVGPPDSEDPGRALVLAWGYRLLGGVAPHLLQWLGVLAALPMLAWLVSELWWGGRPAAAAVFGLLVACSPYAVQSLCLRYSPFGFYLVGLLALFALASYASLAPSISTPGLLLRSLVAGLVLALCLLCRSLTLLLAPGFLLALAVAAGRITGKSRRGRLWVALAAVALLVLPAALSRRSERHEVWAGFWEGLGDFDRSKGYTWDDHEAQQALREAGLPAKWRDLSGAEAQAFFRRRVLADIRQDPTWYLGIVARRVVATVFQPRLWPRGPVDGRSFAPGTSANEGRIDQYYGFTKTIDFVGFGRLEHELPLVLILAPTFLLGCLWIAFRLASNRPGQARIFQDARLMACPALGALGAPVLFTTASGLETQAFVLVYLLGLGLCADELTLVLRAWAPRGDGPPPHDEARPAPEP